MIKQFRNSENLIGIVGFFMGQLNFHCHDLLIYFELHIFLFFFDTGRRKCASEMCSKFMMFRRTKSSILDAQVNPFFVTEFSKFETWIFLDFFLDFCGHFRIPNTLRRKKCIFFEKSSWVESIWFCTATTTANWFISIQINSNKYFEDYVFKCF